MVAPPTPAQAVSDPWWGPSDKTRPTEGHALRVPVVVENPYDWTLPPGTPVVAEVDFGALLVKAGWTNQTQGTEVRVRGFTLDVNSLRVVEYGRGFTPGPRDGPAALPTPHTFYPSLFNAARHREFNATSNPAGTVMFPLSTPLAKGDRAYFYVYANPLEYGTPSAPAAFDLAKRAPLDAYLWGSMGTVTYGYEPQQTGQGSVLQICALESDLPTLVEVSYYTLGRFTLVPATQSRPNPFTMAPSGLACMGSAMTSFVVPGGSPFKIVSSRPILVSGGSPGTERYGYVPATSGHFVGRDFFVYGFPQAPAGGGSTPVNAVAVGPGTITVSVVGGNANQAQQLSLSNPVAVISPTINSWNRITATGDVMLFWGQRPPVGNPVHGHQVPAMTGGPSGYRFLAAEAPDGGYVQMCADQTGTARILDLANPSIQAWPEGSTESAAAGLVPGGVDCTEHFATPATPRGWLDVRSTKEARNAPPGSPQPLRVLLHARERSDVAVERPFVGHFGGIGATDFFAAGRVGIIGHFNDTRFTVQELKEDKATKARSVKTSPLTISADGFVQLPVAADSLIIPQYRILSSKPITVVSTEPMMSPDGSTTYPYARYVPGRPAAPLAAVGPAEFRGPLVELRSPDTDGRQLFRTTAPATPVAVRLDAHNLGRWMVGESLQDTVVVSCRGPAEWTIEGCAREIPLGSAQFERFEISVTPSRDDINVTRTVYVEARSKLGGVASTFRLDVKVAIRYGVNMWFDVEGGVESINPPVGVDPGESHTYTIVVKNTGSAVDRFDVRVGAPAQGWTQVLKDDEDKDVREIQLDPGTSTILKFHVTAPATESAPPNLVSITAQSISSALAADIVNTATRIRPKINVKLEVSPTTRVTPPGETAEFNMTVTNGGNDIFRIVLGRGGLLPEGWNATLGISEIDLGPSERFTFPLRVLPPLGARAGDLATVKVTAETDTGGTGGRIPGDEVSAVVVVRRIHNITTPALVEAVAAPGATVRYVLPVVNHGNGGGTVELLPGATTPSWRLTLAGNETLYLDAGQSGELPLVVDVPPLTPPGVVNFTFTLRLSREALQNLTIPIDVRPTASIAYRGAAELATSQGKPTLLAMVAENVGNLPGTFTFGADAPAGWNVTFSPPKAQLAPGGRIPVAVVLNASRAAPDGSHDVALVASLDGAPAGRTPLPTTLARPDLRLDRVGASGAVRAGDLVLVTASVANVGRIAAENVTVALVVDGRAVDAVVLNRIPIGEVKSATLNWVPDRRTDDVRVVIDPDGDIVEMTQDDGNVAQVTFGSTLPVPGASLLLVVAALALAGRFLGRRR